MIEKGDYDTVRHLVGKEFFVTYGPSSFPTIVRAKLLPYTDEYQLLPENCWHAPVLCVWGFSVYRGKPGFRTLGIDWREFCERQNVVVHETWSDAVAHLSKLLNLV